MTVSPLNGVDVPTLFQTLDVVSEHPDAAKFQFRATNSMLSGTHSTTTIGGFFGAGEEREHKSLFTYDADHPEVLVGKDNGPTPVEFLLHALAACITAGIGNIAAVRGIALKSVESTVTGDIDLMGLLGLDDTVRNGYQGVEMKLRIEGDASAEELRQVVERSVARSAVFDVLTNGTPVSLAVETV
ncbi:MAG: OsmC family protein [Actinobacteria bacterium]|nr:OsmC family protein [Actinomycetota bacterium]